MPHLSDGDLHAWLDGAISGTSVEGESLRLHLDTCADCASRLEEARELKSRSGSILASAVPRESVPSFEEVRARAVAESHEDEGRKGTHRVGGPWLSVQQLGWAATVALALGAGWIGRAVLVEKGWTDPFHEGPPAAESRVSDADIQRAEPLQAPAPEGEAREENRDERGAAEEVGAERQAVMKDEVQPSALNAEAKRRDVEEFAAPAEGEREDDMARSAEAVRDPWHALPEARLSAPTGVAGCYRLEYAWSPGMADLPGTLELTSAQPQGRDGQSLFVVLAHGVPTYDLHEAVWTSQHPDSIWVQLAPGEGQDVLTMRAERSGSGWEGEGRVLRSGGPVLAGQTRGPVRLVTIGCVPS